jgi:hypothetical protein
VIKNLTSAELNGFGCSDPNCTEDHSIVYLHPRCHPEAGTWTCFDKRTGALIIECMECQKPFVSILVASSQPVFN